MWVACIAAHGNGSRSTRDIKDTGRGNTFLQERRKSLNDDSRAGRVCQERVCQARRQG